MTPLIIIPSRLAATRLPNKPLADIAGKPMILHMWERAVSANAGDVVVATDAKEIADVIEAAGGKAVMTDSALPSGSDRVWAALGLVDPDGKYDVVINLQGDMPNFDPAILREVLKPLENPAVDISTLAAPITDEGDKTDNAVVKPIISFPQKPSPSGKGLGEGVSGEGSIGCALYFTRATAPSGEGTLYNHLGLYAFRRAALEKFVVLPPSPLERRERLEQLRALEAGMRIDIGIVQSAPIGVDTPETLEKARKWFKEHDK